MMKRFLVSSTPPGRNAADWGRHPENSANLPVPGIAAVVLAIALAIALAACSTLSGRGPSQASLETAPNAAWGTASVDVRFYELRESEREPLRHELRTARAARGMRGYGDTQWQIKTKYDFTTSGGECEPARVDVSLDVRVTLPRLRNPDALSPELRAEWEKFRRALRDHQANHKQIAIECAERVSAELNEVGSMRCELLAEIMQSTTDEVTSSCHARNADYDLRTRHGSSEGASF